MTRVDRIAEFAVGLGAGDIPTPVLELARAQRRSVLGAVAAAGAVEPFRRVLAAVEGWAAPGRAPLVHTDRLVSVEDAVYAAAAASIALDFDDYLCFGHSGHSAVLVPLLLAAECGAGGPEQLVAQVVANEVEARLGGAALIGPANGQMWSHIHAAGAAAAVARLLGLDRAATAHAVGLALYQPPRATVPGFMAPDSKLVTAAEPTLAGIRAARLAAAGVTGPRDALDHPQGALSVLAEAPLPGLLDGLGTGWATHTLCVKPYPGCAYVDTALDALGALGPVDPAAVRSVGVEAGLLTCGMDAMSRPYTGGTPTAVTVTFSVPWSLAIALVAGELGPDQLTSPWLAGHAEVVGRLAERVALRHDWSFTAASAAGFGPLLPPGRLVADAGGRRLARGLVRTRASHGGLGLGLPVPAEVLRLVGGAGRSRAAGWWDPEALAAFRMRFPARVVVTTADGRRLQAEADIPRGGAGHRDAGPCVVARHKLSRWAGQAWGAGRAAALEAAVASDDDRLWERLAAPVGAGA